MSIILPASGAAASHDRRKAAIAHGFYQLLAMPLCQRKCAKGCRPGKHHTATDLAERFLDVVSRYSPLPRLVSNSADHCTICCWRNSNSVAIGFDVQEWNAKGIFRFYQTESNVNVDDQSVIMAIGRAVYCTTLADDELLDYADLCDGTHRGITQADDFAELFSACIISEIHSTENNRLNRGTDLREAGRISSRLRWIHDKIYRL